MYCLWFHSMFAFADSIVFIFNISFGSTWHKLEEILEADFAIMWCFFKIEWGYSSLSASLPSTLFTKWGEVCRGVYSRKEILNKLFRSCVFTRKRINSKLLNRYFFEWMCVLCICVECVWQVSALSDKVTAAELVIEWVTVGCLSSLSHTLLPTPF